MTINYLKAAEDAGLDRDQVHHFLQGLSSNKGVKELLLERDRFNRLQLAVEEAESEVPVDPDGDYPFRFFYLTRGFLTPAYRDDHPRFDVVRKLFDASRGRSMACAVATRVGFDEQNKTFTPDQRDRLKEFLVKNMPPEGLPSIALTRRPWGSGADLFQPSVNYMALPECEDRAALAFHAGQRSPAALSGSMGSVIFGENARYLPQRVLGELRDNAQRWGSHNILRLLDGA